MTARAKREPSLPELREAAARLAARDDDDAAEALAVVAPELHRRERQQLVERGPLEPPRLFTTSAPSLDEQVAALRSTFDAATDPAVREALMVKLGPLEDAQRLRDMNARTTSAANEQRADVGEREAKRREAWAALPEVEKLRAQIAAAATNAETTAKRADALPLSGSEVLLQLARILRRIGGAEMPASFKG